MQWLPAAVERFEHVLFLTHVPPFKASCWHQGQISDDEFLPHFTCSVMGDVLVDMMQQHPECDLTVLCGQTHSPGKATILPTSWSKPVVRSTVARAYRNGLP